MDGSVCDRRWDQVGASSGDDEEGQQRYGSWVELNEQGLRVKVNSALEDGGDDAHYEVQRELWAQARTYLLSRQLGWAESSPSLQPAELLSGPLGPAGREEMTRTQPCCGDSQGRWSERWVFSR